jgi:hypothetical protein
VITPIDLNPDNLERHFERDDSDDKQSGPADALGSLLASRWNEWSVARREKEEEWLYCLRAFNSQPETDRKPVSELHGHIYYGITRTKVISAYARIVDLMFQPSDAHWGIEPTPIPQLDESLRLQIKQRLLINTPDMAFLTPEMRNEFIALTVAAEKKEITEEAHRRADAMTTEMEDHLLEMRYEDAAKWAIFEGCLFGTGALKGVVPGVKVEQQWQQTVMGYDLVSVEKPAPKLSQVSVFDLYPDPYAIRSEDATGVFERHVLNRRQFAALKDDPAFDSDVIEEILSQGAGKGTHTPLYHETERQRIAGAGSTQVTNSDRFDVLEYWGTISGSMLEAAGVKLPETPEPDDAEDRLEGPEKPEKETEDAGSKLYWANVWTAGGRTLLARLSPLKRQRCPYSFFPFFKSGHSFWGVGVPWMMKHSQAAANGLVQTMLDNAAAASGPQAEVSVNMLKAGEDPKIIPWKVWLRDFGDPAIPAVRFYQPQLIASELEGMLEMFRKFADEETSMPSYTHGEEIPGLNKTASGMSMLMSAANVTTKAVIKNLEDGLILPCLQSLYDWCMEWSDNEDAKGDQQVDVRGSSALIAKEMQSQRLIQFAQLTANPVDLQFVDREKLLREIAQSMDLNPDKIWRDSGQALGFGVAGPGVPPGVAGPVVPGQPAPGAVPGVAGEQFGPPDSLPVAGGDDQLPMAVGAQG